MVDCGTKAHVESRHGEIVVTGGFNISLNKLQTLASSLHQWFGDDWHIKITSGLVFEHNVQQQVSTSRSHLMIKIKPMVIKEG